MSFLSITKRANFHILLIDDEKDFLDSMEIWFKSLGYSIEAVTSGREALELLKTKTPNLILLDIYMPDMDGIETLKKLRRMNDSVPIILLSAHTSEDLRVEAYKAGADGFLDKTLDFYKAEHLINSYVRVAVKEKKHRRRRLSVPLALIIIVCFLLLMWLSTSPFARVCFRETCLGVELAKTSQERERGLMYRENLPQERGMLFVFFKDDFWGFWMKNTYIPLDIIWLDKNKTVVDIVENARSLKVKNPEAWPVFRTVSKARYVLEANSGFVEKNRIKVGDRAEFRWFYPAYEVKR